MLKVCVENDQLKDFNFDLNTKPFGKYLIKDLKCEPYFVFNHFANQALTKTDNPDCYHIMSHVKTMGNGFQSRKTCKYN